MGVELSQGVHLQLDPTDAASASSRVLHCVLHVADAITCSCATVMEAASSGTSEMSGGASTGSSASAFACTSLASSSACRQ